MDNSYPLRLSMRPEDYRKAYVIGRIKAGFKPKKYIFGVLNKRSFASPTGKPAYRFFYITLH